MDHRRDLLEKVTRAFAMYNKETVGDSLDEFLQKVAQLEPLASCEVVNEQISDDNFRTMLWINIPKVKKWMKVRRPNKIHKRQIKSYSDLRAEFGQD